MRVSRVIITLIAAASTLAGRSARASSESADRIQCDAKFENCGSNNPKLMAEIEKLETKIKALKKDVVYGYIFTASSASSAVILKFIQTERPQAKAQLTDDGVFVTARDADLSAADAYGLVDRMEKELHVSPTMDVITLDVKFPVRLY